MPSTGIVAHDRVLVGGSGGPRGGHICSFPSNEQPGLLFQVLHFHEFGHLLYIYHKPELDALVKEIQAEVDEMLMPTSFRNDRHAERQAAERRAIVDTWYKWAQELLCDAVGLAIGGPAFLQAFPSLRMVSPRELLPRT